MISFKLKNTTQFNLNCELAMKFLNKIDTIKFVKTNCSFIYDIEIPYNSINVKIGSIEFYDNERGSFANILLFETMISSLGSHIVGLPYLILINTDETLQEIVKYLNEHISWEVK